MATATPADSKPEPIAVPPTAASRGTTTEELEHLAPNEFHVIRRNGKVTNFDANKIAVAMTKAFLAVEGGSAVSVPTSMSLSLSRTANPRPAIA